MFLGALAALILSFLLIEAKEKDFYTLKVVNSRGRLVSLEKYRGSVSWEAGAGGGGSKKLRFCTGVLASQHNECISMN